MTRSAWPGRGLAGLVLLAGTATLAARPATDVPDGRGFIELKTEHFTLVSNAGDSRTRKLALSLERFRAALARIVRGLDLDTPVPTTILVFKNDAAYTPYKLDDSGAPMNVAGYFLPRPFGNWITLDASAGAAPMRVIFHEYFHVVMQASVGEALPSWLNEGLAEYFSTFRERAGTSIVEIGHPIDEHLFTLERQRIHWADVFTTTPESPTYNEATRQGAFYAQSWLLVHYAGADDTRNQALWRYLSALRVEVPEPEAFRQAWKMEPADLGAAAEGYLESGSSFVWWDLGENDVKVEPASREVEPAEVWFRLGDLLARRGQIETARRHFAAAEAAGWPAAPIDTALAFAMIGRGDAANAEPLLRRAVAAGATGSEPYILLASFLLDHVDSTGLGEGVREVAPEVLEARGLLGAAIERDPESFLAHIELARSYLYAGGGVEAGVAAVEVARTLRPLASETLRLHACLLGRQGRPAAAWQVIARDLEPRNPAEARSARACVTAASLMAAVELAVADDTAGALAVLDAALAGVQDAADGNQLRVVRAAIEGGATIVVGDEDEAAAADRDVDRYNEAIRLARTGGRDEALALLEALAADCTETRICEAAATTAADLREVLAHSRFVTRYNEAIALVNAGDKKGAVKLLRALHDETTDPDDRAEVEDLLRQLGAGNP